MKIPWATTIETYLQWLSDEHQHVLNQIITRINEHRDPWYEMSYRRNMICREIPLSTYPTTYNKQPLMFAAIARQKNNYSLHLTPIYAWWCETYTDLLEQWFKRISKKPNMWKGCIRFKKIEDVPRQEITQIIQLCPVKKLIQIYEDR